MTEFEMMIEMLARFDNIIDYDIDQNNKIINMCGKYSEGSIFYFDKNGKAIDIH